MTQYNTLNVKLSNAQLNKLKSGIKNGTEITLIPSSNVVSDFNYETNFPHKLLLIDIQVSKLPKLLQIIHQLLWNYQKFNYLNGTVRMTFSSYFR